MLKKLGKKLAKSGGGSSKPNGYCGCICGCGSTPRKNAKKAAPTWVAVSLIEPMSS